MKQEYKLKDPINFIKDIKKYLIDKRYIRIDGKPILGLYEPNKVPNLREVIKIWRQKSRQFGIGEIFILISINYNKLEKFQNLNLFDAAYEFPPRNSFHNHRIPGKKTLIYSELLYKSSNLNESNFNIKYLGKDIYIIQDKNGKTKEYYNGYLIYEGEYLNDKRNGKGKEFENDKIIFAGEYKDGKRWNGKLKGLINIFFIVKQNLMANI